MFSCVMMLDNPPGPQGVARDVCIYIYIYMYTYIHIYIYIYVYMYS